MGKILLTKKNIEEYIAKDEKKVYIGGDMILAPSAKDVIRSKGITIVYDEKPTKDKDSNYCLNAEFIKKDIVKILKEDYRIIDNEAIDKLYNEILDKINKK